MKGGLVVVDTADAMLYEVKEGLRAFLQLIYGSVKTKQGSLILISEGTTPATPQLMYIADALLEIELEDVLGRQVRAVRILKDRDRPVESPRYYMTFKDMSIVGPSEFLTRPSLGRLSEVKRPPSLHVQEQLEVGPNLLSELDMSVSDIRARLVAEFVAADYLAAGYDVNYIIGPNERECTLREDMESLVGESAKRLNIIKVDAKSLGFSAERYYSELLKVRHEKNAVNFVNLLAEEDFARNAPLEYENFTYMATRHTVESGTITILYGHKNLRAVEIQEKYANAVRAYMVVDGFMFWRSIRPLGPVFIVKIEPEKGRLDYVEMM